MHASSDLRVYLLDSPRVEQRIKHSGSEGATTPLDFPRVQLRALFYRLAIYLAPVARDHLCYLFWPDAPDATARRNLTLLLSHLRRALPMPELLLTTPEHVQLDANRVWSDSALFIQLCTNAKNRDELVELQKAVTLYRAPLLSGFVSPRDAPEFDLWLSNERQKCEQMALDTLATLTEAFTGRGSVEEAIPYARRYLEIDPLAEDMHRQLMRLYALAGDRSAARRQYELCVEVLERELGVSPLPETHAVYDAILKDQIAPAPRIIKEPIWTTLAGPQVAMAGREQAWQTLRQFYSQAADQRGGVVLLSGEAGIGKSRLIQEFASHLPAQVSVLSAASHPAVQSIPYQPIIEALRPALRAHENIAELSQSWLSVTSLLFPEIRSLYPKVPPPVLLDSEQARGQIFEALCQLLLFLSHRSLVLLCLDDLHWADSTTLDWLSYIARYLRHSRLLILGAYRSEEANSLSEVRIYLNRLRVLSELHLTALGRDEVRQMVAHFYQGESHLERLATRLQTITGGNPFFLLESVQALLESGLSPAAFDATNELPISSTVRATIEQRMERLQPMARQVLEAGAILGPAFDFEVVCQTAGRHEMETIEGLDELVARRFLAAEGKGFRFHHELIQAVVYQGLSFWRRQLLHRRAGEILERLHPNVHDPISGQIAEHYARGDLPAQAIPFYQRAAEVAERVYATNEAALYLMKALELLKSLPNRADHREYELQIHIALGAALTSLKGWSAPEIKEIYTTALALCDQVGDAAQRFHLLWGLQSYHQVQAGFGQARQLAEEMLKLAQDENEAALLASAYFHLGTVEMQSGNFVQGSLYFEQTITLHDFRRRHPATAHIRPDYGVLAHCFSSTALWHLGYPEKALAHSRQACALATGFARPFDLVVALTYTAMLYHFCRQIDLVEETAQEAAALSQEHGFAYYLTWATILLGWVQVERGEMESGIATLRRGLADFDKTGAAIRKPYYLCLLAEALGRADETQQALALVDKALALISTSGERWSEAELYRQRGELLLAQGVALEEVLSHFEQALEIARHQQAKSLQLRIIMSLCRVWQQQGKVEEARRKLAEIYGWFTEGFDTPELMQAQSLLQLLSH